VPRFIVSGGLPELGRERITDESGHLVEVLAPLLADITSINVTWPPNTSASA